MQPRKKTGIIADKCLESDTHTHTAHQRQLAGGQQAAHNPRRTALAQTKCAAAERNLSCPSYQAAPPMPVFQGRGVGHLRQHEQPCGTPSMSCAATCADCLQDDHVRDNPSSACSARDITGCRSRHKQVVTGGSCPPVGACTATDKKK